MGGPGSGNHYHWWRLGRKTTVEECRALDLRELARKGAFVPWYCGSLSWFRGEQEMGSIGYQVVPTEGGEKLLLVLSYRWSSDEKESQSIKVPIFLETTRPHFGGLRWWGRCPLEVGGVPCRRRVAKLYLPPGSRYFGCRQCHQLTYHSAQTHDGRVSRLRRNPALLAALMENLQGASVTQLGLALKALGRL
jgi:hypothetical protein